MDMVNAMLLNDKLPNNLWGEVLLTACHIHNRVLSKKSNVSPCRTRHRGGPQIILELWKKNRYLTSCSFRGKGLV